MTSVSRGGPTPPYTRLKSIEQGWRTSMQAPGAKSTSRSSGSMNGTSETRLNTRAAFTQGSAREDGDAGS